MIRQGIYHQEYICDICGWKVNWIEVRGKGWGKAQKCRKILNQHKLEHKKKEGES
jgi:hypothetical protein